MFGYHGRYLHVDLSTGKAETKPLGESVLRRFIGGVGLGTYLLHQESPSQLDALSPAELRKVRDYERRRGNRKSVLDAIEAKLG